MSIRKHARNKILGGLVLSAALAFAPQAQAFDFGVLGGVNMTQPKLTVNGNEVSGTTGATGLAYGAFVTLPLIPMAFDMEIGGLLVDQKVKTNSGSSDTTVSFKNLQIPVIFRFKPIPVISPGVGVYYATATGDITTSKPGTGDTTQTFAAANQKSTDIGLVASVKAAFDLAPMISFVVDGRYNLGLKNLNSQTTVPIQDYKLPSVQIFGGIQFGL